MKNFLLGTLFGSGRPTNSPLPYNEQPTFCDLRRVLKTHLLHIALFVCGLLLVNSPITAQVLLPQYSVWEGFAFGDKHVVESREAEERFARFLLGLERVAHAQQSEEFT